MTGNPRLDGKGAKTGASLRVSDRVEISECDMPPAMMAERAVQGGISPATDRLSDSLLSMAHFANKESFPFSKESEQARQSQSQSAADGMSLEASTSIFKVANSLIQRMTPLIRQISGCPELSIELIADSKTTPFSPGACRTDLVPKEERSKREVISLNPEVICKDYANSPLGYTAVVLAHEIGHAICARKNLISGQLDRSGIIPALSETLFENAHMVSFSLWREMEEVFADAMATRLLKEVFSGSEGEALQQLLKIHRESREKVKTAYLHGGEGFLKVINLIDAHLKDADILGIGTEEQDSLRAQNAENNKLLSENFEKLNAKPQALDLVIGFTALARRRAEVLGTEADKILSEDFRDFIVKGMKHADPIVIGRDLAFQGESNELSTEIATLLRKTFADEDGVLRNIPVDFLVGFISASRLSGEAGLIKAREVAGLIASSE